MSRIYVLGVGPGGAGFVPPRTRKLALSCDLLIGGRRNLELFTSLAVEKREIGRDIDALLDFVAAVYRQKRVGILISGDPGLFSLLAPLRRRFSPDVLEVVPAVSALQYLFARICLPWHDAAIFSLHGRPRAMLARELAAAVRQHAKVGLFTDGRNTPALVCELLLQEGIRDRQVHIGENLSYPDEKLYRGSLEQCRGLAVGPLNVMVIIDEERQ
ncbi:MAG: precorrin-6y C5,15-methyltransferase (decarboxylating) subunit CbiE [Bacillota bacterium]